MRTVPNDKDWQISQIYKRKIGTLTRQEALILYGFLV